MTPIEMLRAEAKEIFTTERAFVDSIDVVLSSSEKYGNQEGQRLGNYDPLKKRIVLWDVFKDSQHPEMFIDSIFPTYAHELIHALQHRYMGTLVYLLTLIFCRPLFEKACEETEERFYRYIEWKASQPIAKFKK